MVEISSEPHTRRIVTQLMEETLDIAARVGSNRTFRSRSDCLERRTVGHHKTSMLRDLKRALLNSMRS
jgi:2-dehydropantoate 2-reductase